MPRRFWANGAEGGTPLSADALNELEDDLEYAGAYRLSIGTVTVGTAAATLGDKTADNQQKLNLSLPALDSFGWLVACFLDNGEAGEKLSLFYSPDGKTIFGGQQNPVYWPDRLRDPSIIYYQGRFHVAYTLNDGTGRNFRVISSPNGAPGTWSITATVDVSSLVAAGDKCWAPELVIDGANVYVFFTWQKATTSETTAGSGNGVLSSMGWVRATNTLLTAWTGPTALATSGFANAYIDGVPVKYGADWYFFSSGGSQIYRARSTSGITGTYTQDRTGDWAGWGTGIEGPYITKIGSTYRIYFDRYVANTGHWYSESSDLSTWTAPAQLLAAPGTLPEGGKVRHGSFLQLPNMDAATKAMANTLGAAGPMKARFRYSKSIPTAAVTDMGGQSLVVDPVGVVRGADAAGNFYVVQGGTYLVTAHATITSAVGTATRTFLQFDDGAGGVYGRVSMGGVGEDTFTGTVQASLPMNGRMKLSFFHNQGAAKTVTVDVTVTRLGN